MARANEREQTFGELAHIAKESMPIAYATRRRLWAARDEVIRLEALLAQARSELAAMEREDGQTERFIRDVYEHLRQEHERLALPPSEDARP